MPDHLPANRERLFITLLILVQLVNAIDFMMVMPLAPDFAAALGFPISAIGLIAAAFSIASAIAGFIAALFLDQYSRKHALVFCLAGLVVTSLLTVFAWNLESMIVLRAVTGFISGPIFGICGAFAADVIPPHRRGVAVGKLMGAFSIATIIGIPFGLELSHYFGWQAPFIGVSLLGAGVLAAAMKYLPHYAPAPGTLQPLAHRAQIIGHLLRSPVSLAGYGCSAVAMLASFMIIPNMAAYLQMNMGYPREYLGLLYLAGGGLAFFTQRLAGQLVDRTSATLTSVLFGIIFIVDIYQGFVLAVAAVPAMLTFVLYMIGMTGRGIAAQTLASKVPPPAQRGAFMVVQGAIINVAAALGGYYSSLILVEENGRLLHMDTVGWTAIALSLLVPLLFWYTERKVGNKPH